MAATRFYLNPFSFQQAELITRLSPDECRDRLKPLLLPWHRRLVVEAPLVVIPLAKPDRLAGVASREGFRVRLAVAERVGGGMNSFQTEASGRFIPSADGTRIPMRLGLMRGVALSLLPMVGVALVIVSLAIAWMFSFAFASMALGIVVAIITAPILLASFLGILWWGRHSARGEAASLMTLLCAALDAHVVSPPSGVEE